MIPNISTYLDDLSILLRYDSIISDLLHMQTKICVMYINHQSAVKLKYSDSTIGVVTSEHILQIRGNHKQKPPTTLASTQRY